MKQNTKTFSIHNPYIFWILIALIYFSILSFWNIKEAIYNSIHYTILQALIVQMNLKILLNKYSYNSRKYKIYSIILLLTFVLISTGLTIIAIKFILPARQIDDRSAPFVFIFFFNIFFLGVPLFISTFFDILKKEREHLKEIKSLIKLQSETELKFLKSQINPHFLFNALNTIYTISYIGDKSAPDKILKLSDMLRYVLYDCKSDHVLLSREIDYIISYIDFQQLKTEKPQNINFLIDNVKNNNHISPMILIPFIENSFKHSKIDTDKNAWVNIDLICKNDNLIFKIENSIPKIEAQNWLNSEGGIGLENVKKRLNLLYPEKYSLHIEKNKNIFKVVLNINLK
ncbi:sensor histidine kinase [Aureivirga sp. CE67]|uniref:sensor histidine kinase n=1 Tax=Aureivirga sp. CE67 TaxID=1788983 RepID=UPI0018C963EE|nr:histidine kinase [Aureivirga sp. CE67]